MANLRITAAIRNAMLQKIIDAIDVGGAAGTLKIYSGTQPATPETALSGNTLLATLTFTRPSGAAPSGGVLTFSTITEDSSADAIGTATFARILDSTGAAVFDGDVGTSAALIILNRTDFVVGGPVRITSFTITIPTSMTF